MKTYVRFCTHLRRDSLNIYRAETCAVVEEELQGKTEHAIRLFAVRLNGIRDSECRRRWHIE